MSETISSTSGILNIPRTKEVNWLRDLETPTVVVIEEERYKRGNGVLSHTVYHLGFLLGLYMLLLP